MVQNPFSISLTHKSPLFGRLFSCSSKPISNFSQRSQLSINPVQISGLKACSYPISCSNSRIEFKGFGCFDLRWPENVGRICASAGSGGGSGGAGGPGGSGGGNSGGGGETDGGSSGGIDWSFFSWFFIPAILNCIGDLIRQLVFEQASSVDLKRTAVAGSMGLPLVGHTLRSWSLVDQGMSDFFRGMLNFFLAMALSFLFVLFCCIQLLVVAYNFTMRNRTLEDDIKSLPKYKYSPDNRLMPINDDGGDKNRELVGSNELSLFPDDSDCCICLSSYLEGEELNVLPCKHHFHCDCIGKWLRINATCPVCKFSIRRGVDLPDSNSTDTLNAEIPTNFN